METENPTFFLDSLTSLFSGEWLVYGFAMVACVAFSVIGIKLIKSRNKPN
jgi:hypothetical protein